jgi:hypothetical protein
MLPAELETEAQLIFQRGSGGPGWGYRALTFDTQFFRAMKHREFPFGVLVLEPTWLSAGRLLI